MKSKKETVSGVPITIRALQIQDNRNGTFTVTMRGRVLNSEEHKFLENLFPTITDEAYRLLDIEALLANLASNSEANAPPQDDLPSATPY
jgi:hypothetical protein